MFPVVTPLFVTLAAAVATGNVREGSVVSRITGASPHRGPASGAEINTVAVAVLAAGAAALVTYAVVRK